MKNFIRVIFGVMLFVSLSFAEDEKGATKADIKVLIELIKSNQEATNKRFEDIQKHTDKRFEDMQKYMDKRFDDVNKRFEFMQSLMFALLAAIFGLIGYSIYDRKKVIKDSRDEFEKIVEEKLVLKADKKALDMVFSIIDDLAKVDEKVRDIAKNHHFNYQG